MDRLAYLNKYHVFKVYREGWDPEDEEHSLYSAFCGNGSIINSKNPVEMYADTLEELAEQVVSRQVDVFKLDYTGDVFEELEIVVSWNLPYHASIRKGITMETKEIGEGERNSFLHALKIKYKEKEKEDIAHRKRIEQNIS